LTQLKNLTTPVNGNLSLEQLLKENKVLKNPTEVGGRRISWYKKTLVPSSLANAERLLNIQEVIMMKKILKLLSICFLTIVVFLPGYTTNASTNDDL